MSDGDLEDVPINIRTSSGTTYLVSADRSRVCRLPPMDAGTDEGAAVLRRDLEWLDLLEMGELRVGHPAVFVLEPLGDPSRCAYTTRLTTPVVEILAATSEADSR